MKPWKFCPVTREMCEYSIAQNLTPSHCTYAGVLRHFSDMKECPREEEAQSVKRHMD